MSWHVLTHTRSINIRAATYPDLLHTAAEIIDDLSETYEDVILLGLNVENEDPEDVGVGANILLEVFQDGT